MLVTGEPIDFEGHRSHLRDVAFRLLGSLAEADDAVQEAWLRLARADPGDVVNPRGWLTTVVSRICLDMLRSRTARREEPLDVRADRSKATDTEEEMVLADSVGLAWLVVLDRLEPAERIAFVLHDVFGLPFSAIASIVARSPEATRQLASRARRRIRGQPMPDADLATQRHVVDAFIAALRRGDIEGLIALLDPEVVARAPDGAGGTREVRGARTWAAGAVAFAELPVHMSPALIDGGVGLVFAPTGRLSRALRITFGGGRIEGVEVIADRAQLAMLEIAPIPATTSGRPG
jgi:RNA polymerase sigma-70 factor (ECF subfamily)